VSVLVAGVGNIFFGDDGFGSEVIRALAGVPLDDAKVVDYGIRGMHLAYELCDGHERAILIDAVPRGEPPGTLYVIQPDATVKGDAPDAHRMDLQNVFAFVKMIGGEAPPLVLVGCEPATTDEGIGLSEPVRQAVPAAVEIVRKLVEKEMPWSAA
jgi:hydrogenase maturation protease